MSPDCVRTDEPEKIEGGEAPSDVVGKAPLIGATGYALNIGRIPKVVLLVRLIFIDVRYPSRCIPELCVRIVVFNIDSEIFS